MAWCGGPIFPEGESLAFRQALHLNLPGGHRPPHSELMMAFTPQAPLRNALPKYPTLEEAN